MVAATGILVLDNQIGTTECLRSERRLLTHGDNASAVRVCLVGAALNFVSRFDAEPPISTQRQFVVSVPHPAVDRRRYGDDTRP